MLWMVMVLEVVVLRLQTLLMFDASDVETASASVSSEVVVVLRLGDDCAFFWMILLSRWRMILCSILCNRLHLYSVRDVELLFIFGCVELLFIFLIVQVMKNYLSGTGRGARGRTDAVNLYRATGNRFSV